MPAGGTVSVAGVSYSLLQINDFKEETREALLWSFDSFMLWFQKNPIETILVIHKHPEENFSSKDEPLIYSE